MSTRFPLRLGALLVLTGVALAACTPSAPPPPPRSAPALPQQVEGAACIAALSYANAAFNRIPDSGRGEQACGVATAISLIESVTPLNRPVDLDCTTALRFVQWDVRVVQPLARELFGQGVKKIHHFGGYVCRGRSSNRRRLSEHAFGRAIDIGAFELDDGTIINIRRHWSGAGAKSTFLRRSAAGACPIFNVVLTPAHDAAHADHFHMDTGPWTLCRI